jgi:hypothetical protein
MLDANLVAQMVEQEIRSAVNQQVQQAVEQTEWITDLENQIIQFVQDRITARFSNIGTMPDLVSTVEKSVGKMFEQGFVPDLESYVDSVKIQQTVDQAVEQFVSNTIDSLTVDPQWIKKIETLVEQKTAERMVHRIRDIDVNAEMQKLLFTHKDTILDELTKKFSSTGITDQATSLQLTVMDGVVVVENETVTHDLTVERNTILKGDVLIKGNLGVQGKINTDNETWQELSTHVGNVTYDRIKNDFAQELIKTVIDTAKQGIDIDSITVDGSPLLSGDTLSQSVTKSSLKQVGTLNTLNVNGLVNLRDTVYVVNNRIGINTEDPDSALSVWDEEVNVNAGKFGKNTGFIGTGRKQNLVLGTNRQNHVEIDADGLTTIQRLRVGRNNISWGTEVPNYSGTKGDIVFNLNAGPDTPFAWSCLVAFRWQSLRASK